MSTIDKHENGTPSWFDLMTPEPEAARKFYATLFGWSYEIGDAESGNYTMCKVENRNACGMGPLPPGAPMPSAWTVYFNVDDLDKTITAIKTNGGNLVMGPMDVFEQGRLGVGSDSTGAVFGMWQPKSHQGAGIKDQHGAMGWQELHTRDSVKARDFYARTFKLEPVKVEGMDYWTLDRGKQQHGGIFQDNEMPQGMPNYWLAYFNVDDPDKVVASVKSGGGKVMMAASDTPYGRMAVVSDPWGAVFAVIKPPKK